MEELRKVKETRAAQIVDALQERVRPDPDARGRAEGRDRPAEVRSPPSQSRKATELEAMRKEADSAKSLYDVLLQKLNETDIASSIRNNNVSIIERAMRAAGADPPAQAAPRRLGLLVGLALGIGLILGRDYLDNTITRSRGGRALPAPRAARGGARATTDATCHLVTEAYQNLRTALIFARREERGQVVLVTGTAPQEGKTTTLLNLAHAAGLVGRAHARRRLRPAPRPGPRRASA